MHTRTGCYSGSERISWEEKALDGNCSVPWFLLDVQEVLVERRYWKSCKAVRDFDEQWRPLICCWPNSKRFLNYFRALLLKCIAFLHRLASSTAKDIFFFANKKKKKKRRKKESIEISISFLKFLAIRRNFHLSLVQLWIMLWFKYNFSHTNYVLPVSCCKTTDWLIDNWKFKFKLN